MIAEQNPRDSSIVRSGDDVDGRMFGPCGLRADGDAVRLRVLYRGAQSCRRWDGIGVGATLAANQRQYARRRFVGIARRERDCEQRRYAFGIGNRNQ
jgi:hypothetical protein